LTAQPSPTPGWYPDPTGRTRRAYWNGREWESPQPRPPFNKRVLIIVGSIVGGLVLLGLLGNIGSNGDDAKPTASTLTKTVTVTAQPPTVTATATVTLAAPPAPFVAPPAPISEPSVEAMPPLPPFAPLMPPIPSSAYYGSCAAARSAGAAPLHIGEPGYRPGLDGDRDGVACE
jgi:excalibur calcium-binding domain-containing protein